jgi:tRNA-Thr(GGU) m(6)t(6)A37 methyltransferase TsaA
MDEKSTWRAIGVIRTRFTTAAGTPIQPAYGADARGEVEVEPQFSPALDHLDGFERIWLLYWMHTAGPFTPHVIPYRDTQVHGLFATRAPNRPNPIGISAVRLLGRHGRTLEVADLDILDGTPLLDIKPYVPAFDAHVQSRAGWFETPGCDRQLADARFHAAECGAGGTELATRRAAFLARTEQYRKLGFDRFGAAEFIAAAAGPLTGPVLDVGTGRGLTAMSLARRGLDVVSVDPDTSEQALAAHLAEEAGLSARIRFVSGDAASVAYPPGHFGSAVLAEVLHHLPGPLPVLEVVGRLVRLGGTIVLAEFDRAGFDLVASVHREEGGEHPVSGFTLDAAVEWLATAGYRVRTRTAGHLHDIAVLVRER